MVERIEIVLVRCGGPGEVARRLRRVERQLGQERLPRGKAGGDPRELREIAAAHARVLVHALEVRLVPGRTASISRRPAARRRAPRSARGSPPAPARPPRRRASAPAARGPGDRGEHLLGRRRPDAGQEQEHPEARHPVARVLGAAQDREQVLDVRRLEELEAAVLHERDVAPRQLDLERRRCGATVRKSTACALSAIPASRAASTARRRRSRPGRPRRARVTSRGAPPTRGRSRAPSRTAPRPRPITAFAAARIGCVER